MDESGKTVKRHLYLSEQTDGTESNKLVLVTAEMTKPRLGLHDTITTWGEQAHSKNISKPVKTVVHPGEVNRVLDLPHHPNIVVTHSDTPLVYVWNFDSQKDRTGDRDRNVESKPDLTLVGHEQNAEFALGVSDVNPLVASGGKDKKVLIWGMEDYVTSRLGAGGRLHARVELTGHAKTVEDVTFMPGGLHQLASVADDYSLLFWDTREGVSPVASVTRAHGNKDVHCCDWSELSPNLVVTGAQDGGVKVWDRRNLKKSLAFLNHHTKAVMNVEWSPHDNGVLATGADDGLVCVWNLHAGSQLPSEGSGPSSKRLKVAAQEELMFQHAGHQSPVADFCWNPDDPWTLMSASVDTSGGGGTLQLWRISELIYRKEEDVLAELEPFKEYIATGDEKYLQKSSVRA